MGPNNNDTDEAGNSDRITDEEFFELYGVPRQDSYTCVACGDTAFLESSPVAVFGLLDGETVVICEECNKEEDWKQRARDRRHGKARDRTRFLTVETLFRTPIRTLASWLSIHEFNRQQQTKLLIEHWLFVRRLAAVLAGFTLVLVGIILLAGITGSIFVSTTTGKVWIEGAIQLYQTGAAFLVAQPRLILAVLGIAYFAHLYDYHQSIRPQVADLGYTRPRWHYLAVFAATGFIGGLGWSLIDAGLLIPSVLPGAAIVWSVGVAGLIYFLHYTLLEDRWSYGLRIRSAFWKFPVQFAAGLKIYDGVIGLPGSAVVSSLVAIIPPVVGLLYVGRRYFAFTETWLSVQQALYRATRWCPLDRSSAGDGIWQSPTTGPFDEKRPANEESRMDTDRIEPRDNRIEQLETELARLTEELEEARASDSAQKESEDTEDPEDLLPQLLRIKTNLERALDADGEVREGVEMIDRQIETVLEREGIEMVDASGSVDPTKHKVVGTVESPEHEPGEIVDIYRPGFRQGDRILQEAYVVVAADPDAEESRDS